MSKKEAISGALKLLPGITTRHNRALREVGEWSGAVQKFMTDYDLYGSSDYDLLLGNTGNAKFDLTAIAYKGRPLIKRARKIKGQEISLLISEILTGVENLRKILINPTLQNEIASKTIINLRASYEKLRDALSTIELM